MRAVEQVLRMAVISTTKRIDERTAILFMKCCIRYSCSMHASEKEVWFLSEQSQGHNHGHRHEHKYRKQIVNRLSRIEGHVRSVKEMTSDGRDCSDILLQIAAIRKALDNAAKLLLKDHLESCVVDALRHGEQKTLEDLNKALDHFIR